MWLPDSIKTCIRMLEDAGFAAYAVGGCVRDSLLGLTPHDYDLCTAATPAQIRDVFSDYRLVLAGEKHGTVSVVMDGGLIEITTFRTEGDYTDNRHPGWVRFVTDIESDLSRRDFTVNAMAYSPTRGFADPFGGREDLKNRVLRAVGDPSRRFTEDALRILRGVRFSVRYGLSVEKNTAQAMGDLAPLMDHLARERVFAELCGLLPLVKAEDIFRFQPILTQVIPELEHTVGFDQKNPHHALDLYSHIAHVVQSVPNTLVLRWAALLHDIGKPGTFSVDNNGIGHFIGHAQLGAEIANAILLRLKAPAALRQQVVALIERHMTPLEADKRLLRRQLGKYGADATLDLLQLQQADFSSKGTQEETDLFRQIRCLIDEIQKEDACLSVKDLAINGNDLIAIGFTPGPGIRKCLELLLSSVQEEVLSNTKESLLTAAQAYKEETL